MQPGACPSARLGWLLRTIVGSKPGMQAVSRVLGGQIGLPQGTDIPGGGDKADPHQTRGTSALVLRVESERV